MNNIMKVPDLTSGHTQYILYPDRIYEIEDTDKGAHLYYGDGNGGAHVANHSARDMKRSIQDQLDEPQGYLKTEYDLNGTTYKRYFNVNHIVGVQSHGTLDRNDKVIQVCTLLLQYGGVVKLYHSAHEVAFQIRRVLKRLDQDEDICCAPRSEEETE